MAFEDTIVAVRAQRGLPSGRTTAIEVEPGQPVNVMGLCLLPRSDQCMPRVQKKTSGMQALAGGGGRTEKRADSRVRTQKDLSGCA